jgi:hypothetical protein
MKKVFFAIIFFISLASNAQVGIGVSAKDVQPSAQLEVKSTTKGLLIPRMTKVEKIAILSPASGLLVYQTDGTKGFYYYDGTIWKSGLGSQGATGAPGETGSQGPIGLTGVQGMQGLQGLPGNPGTNGLDGKKILNGTIDPSNELTGVDGDFYLNTSTLTFFGPKFSGSWPSGVLLIGKKGDQGESGDKGDQGLQGEMGLKGDVGDKGDKGETGATGPQGPIGLSGAPGLQGEKGLKGDAGDKGDLGDKGDKGDQGLAGSNASITLGEITTANSKAATIKEGILSLAPADENNAGIVTNGSQTIGGAKTFTGAVAVGGASSTASAIVEVSSTTQGFLPPRMTAAQRDVISSPVAGLVLWCTNCGDNGELNVYNGTSWTNFIGGTTSNAVMPSGVTKVYHNVDGVIYSFDGKAWETASANNTQGAYLSGASYLGIINGKVYHYVSTYNPIDGETYVLYSFDGTTLETVSANNTPEGNLSSVSYLGVLNGKAYHNVYNPMNGGNYVLYSFDGTTWETVSANNIPTRNLSSESYLGVINGKAYHYAYTYNPIDGGTYVLYSFDGTTWETVSANDIPSGNLSSGSSLGVIKGKAYHKIFDEIFSFDGTTWATVSANNTPNGNLGDGSYLGVIKGKAYHNVYGVIYSFDGTTWETVSAVDTPGGNLGGWLSDMGAKSFIFEF